MKTKLNKTYCIGYWALSNNVKHDLTHYTKLLPETLGMLAGEKVVFFYDEPFVLERVMEAAAEHDVTVHSYRVALKDLPCRESALKVLDATEEYGRLHSEPPPIHKKEKALGHYWRDYEKSGQEAYLNMLSIWLSKILLIAKITEENPFGSSDFAWVDASLARFNNKRDFYQIARVVDCKDKISFYRGKLLKNGKRLALNASYMSGSEIAWERLTSLFQDQLSLIKNEVYPNDEETVLDHCYTEDPSLFRVINPKRHTMIVRIFTKLGLGAYRWGCY